MAEHLLVAVIACPGREGWKCGTEFEGAWLEPEDPEDDSPEESIQLCPGCGHVFTASWPGYGFRTEAGLAVAVSVRGQEAGMGRLKGWLALPPLLLLVTALAACSSSGGYAQPYVVGEAYCPNDVFATCVVMSDGDIVGPVGNGILDGILYGMVLSPYGGGYRFTRQPPSVTSVSYRHFTVVQPAASYAGRRPVTPSAEASAEKSGDTYNAGGRSYPKSPAALKRKAATARDLAAKAAASKAARSRYAKQQAEPQDDVPAGHRKPARKAPSYTSYRARTGK